MAASTSRQTQTIAEQPSGSCGRGFDALELLGDGREDEMPALRMTPSPERKSFFPPDHIAKHTEFPPPSDETETKASGMLTCEVCGASFETKRGLSSHARSHLRQLGVLESSGAPIDLLYQLSKDKAMDGQLSPGLSRPLAAKKFPHRTSLKLERDAETPDGSSVSLSHLASTSGRSSSPTTLGRSRSASPMLRKAPISSLLPASHGHKSSSGQTASAGPRALTKPLWAPQDTDAPLNLTLDMDASKDIVCQLCGAWFETRKGLSSHARAHLRHFGIVVESKGSPIDILNQVIHTDDFKHQVSALQHEISEEFGGTIACLSPSSPPPPPPPPRPPASAACSPVPSPAPRSQSSPLSSPSKKRPKVSLEGNAALRVFQLEGGEQAPLSHNERSKEISCEFCGEYFENRKGLSSHARSHLRQMGITEWTVNGSPIDTLGEVITRRRLPCAPPARTVKSPLLSPGSPRSPKRLSLPGGLSRPPTARKAGTPQVARLVSELKPDSAPLQLSAEGGPVRAGGYTANPLRHSWGGSDSVQPLSLVQTAKAQELDPTRDVRCELCGEYFENRKGLSSHARSHLRQMGITEWTVNGSPIDTLREVVHQRGGSPSEEVKKEPGLGSNPTLDELGCLSRKPPLSPLPPDPRHHKPRSCGTSPSSAKGGGFSGVSQLGKRLLPEEERLVEKCTPLSKSFSSPPPQDLTFKGKSSPDKNGSGRSDSSCELCGFYFENRKALASHSRAHLRQFGVTRWCVNGSPIETLAAWIRSKPQKVAEIQRRYARGGWPLPKKKSYLSPSSDSDGLVSLTQKPLSAQSTSARLPTSRRAGREVSGRVSASSRLAEARAHARQTFALRNPQVAHSELNVRLPRGFERRPPKHLPHSEGGGREGGLPRPPRTGTVPALVPKPPSTPLVKMVGKLYSLKCRFCEVEFRGPLSVQEDWVRHLQQHILDLNFGKPGSPGASPPADAPVASTSASAAPVSLTPTSSALAAAPAPIPIAAQAV